MQNHGSEQRYLEIVGANEHNLKNISLKIPKNKLVVITGPSGSGKSSLAFDTIFAEGQRRFLESLSAYARQFVEQMKKPEVESIRGLAPAIAIQQKGISKSPRSTAGTLTEIYDYLRLLYSRLGEARCPNCQNPISSISVDEILDRVLALSGEPRVNIMGLVAKQRKGEFSDEIDELVSKGLNRARIDGEDAPLFRGMKLDRTKPHTLEVYLDRLVVKPSASQRIRDAIEIAQSVGQGIVIIENLDSNKSVFFNRKLSCTSCGRSIPEMSPRLFSFNSPLGACTECHGLGYLKNENNEEDFSETCKSCGGSRLKEEPRSVYISEKSIVDLHESSIEDLSRFMDQLEFEGNKGKIAEKVLKEIRDRLHFLTDVGLGYLSLSRTAVSLSGGEEQRLHLATQIGSKLTGVLYVLDEPSIGLHQFDNQKLISSLKSLRDLGNTVIVVEHDKDTILAADHVIDLGPGAGRLGGKVVEDGAPSDLTTGITAEYLLGKKFVPWNKDHRTAKKFLKIKSAHKHNLKNISLEIPLGCFNVITGVSGSGKSTLVMDVLLPSIQYRKPIGCLGIEGLDEIDKIIAVDQSPIGRSSRSNPATYLGIFDNIRQIFAATALAKARGFTSSRFSFNVKGGRCETCLGAGVLNLEMHFLPDVTVDCESCGGRRYNHQTLGISFKGKNIFDVLELTFEEAFLFFESVPNIAAKVKILNDVGLSYLKMGQSALTLSGGEAQRLKLAKEIAKRETGKTLYIFDEPTTGLHFSDIEKLLSVIQRLVDLGNTVIVVEHHLDIIKCADFVIDLGPTGGISGGKIIASGTPEAISKNKESKTGFFLNQELQL